MKHQTLSLVLCGLSMLLTSTAFAAEKFFAEVKAPFGESFEEEWTKARDKLAIGAQLVSVDRESIFNELFVCDTDDCAIQKMRAHNYRAVAVRTLTVKSSTQIEVKTLGIGAHSKALRSVKNINPKDMDEAVALCMEEIKPLLAATQKKEAEKAFSFLYDQQHCLTNTATDNNKNVDEDDEPVAAKKASYKPNTAALDSLTLPAGKTYRDLSSIEKAEIKAKTFAILMKEFGKMLSDMLDDAF